MNDNPKATVVVLTRNGMPLIESCLSMVSKQETPWPFEILVIDSESTDGTLNVIKSFQTELMEVSPKSFGHGKTRNLGADKTRGKFMVFLVQDAIPCDRLWLKALVGAVEEARAAGGYGRQVPRPGSNALVSYYVENTSPNGECRLLKSLPEGTTSESLSPQQRFALAQFTNVSSCIRRSVWEKYPFAEIPYGEDLEWGHRIIQAGESLVYEPLATVFHSHDRSSWYELRRAYADHFLVQQLFGLVMIPSFLRAVRTSAYTTFDNWRHLSNDESHWQEKLALIARSPVLACARTTGAYVGAKMAALSPQSQWLGIVDRMLREGV